jgi:hypothetical protein
VNERSENLEDLPDKYLECRDMGHSWRTVSKGVSRGGIEIIRFNVCRSCKSLRKDRFHRFRGVTTARSYQYSDGYLLTQGAAPRGRAAFRAEMVNRMAAEELPVWDDGVTWDEGVPRGTRRAR